MEQVCIGIIGSGYAARVHADAVRKVYGISAKICAVASIDSNVHNFAKKYHIPQVYSDYKIMLENKTINVVDICSPTCLHEEMILNAAALGKHIVCEKPLTGSFPDDSTAQFPSKIYMYQDLMKRMNLLKRTIEKNGVMFMYAENWIYSPAVQKSVDIIRNSGSRILFMRGQESQGGYHSPYAARWSLAGGGTLLRLGSHPVAAILYLKKVESTLRGIDLHVTEVVADTGTITKALTDKDKSFITASPVDVEDWGNLSMTFSDNTQAVVTVGDMMIGGARNYLEIYSNDNVCMCHMTPNNQLVSFIPHQRSVEGISIGEKLETSEGWQLPWIAEDVMRGFNNEMQDFCECVAHRRRPVSGFDIAYETARVIYAGYVSSEEGKRIILSQISSYDNR